MTPPTGEESSASGHEEVGVDAAESGEEYMEATPEQLSAAGAEAGDESALSDLPGSAKAIRTRCRQGKAHRSTTQAARPEKSSFLSLVPWCRRLSTTVGPAVAKAVASKMKTRSRTPHRGDSR